MKLFTFLFVAITFLFSSNIIVAQQAPYEFVAPKPNSVMVSNETNIILRSAEPVLESTLSLDLIEVVGSNSGIHSGMFFLSDDGNTIVFNPAEPFFHNEQVTVTVHEGIKTFANNNLAEFTFTFKTETEGIIQLSNGSLVEELMPLNNIPSYPENQIVDYRSLPVPDITIDSLNNPGSGYIFLAAWDRNVPHIYANFIFILDSAGGIVDSLRIDGAPFDFKVQPNGYLSYARGNIAGIAPLPGDALYHMVLDVNLAVVDSFKMKNGYDTDFHEFLMLPNGHVMMMSYHTIIFDMSQIVAGGQTNCSLVINIIQEQDINKNVVFEWRNIDYIPITESDLDLTASRVNYGTLNGFDLDTDGNILASFRNHSEIMKINRRTGELMWRMGSPRGVFTFIGEHEENAPYYYSRQHNVKRLPNGNISIFDNGQSHVPPYSRAVEYEIDEVNKNATLIDEWRYPNGNIFTVTAGNAQRLPNGGWFIGYGVPHPQQVKRNTVEVHPNGSIALELSLPMNILAYRAYKMPWNELIEEPSVTYFEVIIGDTLIFNDPTNITGVTINIIDLTGDPYNLVTVTKIPFGPEQAEFDDDIDIVYPVSVLYEGAAITSQISEIHIDLSVYPQIINPEKTSLFIRATPNQGVFTILPTVYDTLLNELIATTTTFGEIIFAETDYNFTANQPILYEPMDEQRVFYQDSIYLRWTGRGMYDSFQVQVATDSSFNNIVVDSNLNLSFLKIGGLLNQTTYYWRVRSMLGNDISDWSSPWHFLATDAFVELNAPNGGESWSMGSNQIIRWETNVSDSVRLDLIYQDQVLFTIDTSRGVPTAYEWLIPSTLTPDSNYKIVITSIINSSLTDTSQAVFTITPPSTIENQGGILPGDYYLYQNYPNPFNPTTKIDFQIPQQGPVSLIVYDVLGNEVLALVNEEMPSGKYSINVDASGFSSGIYFYRLVADNFSYTRKMILLK